MLLFPSFIYGSQLNELPYGEGEGYQQHTSGRVAGSAELARQGKARQGKARQGKARQGKGLAL